MAERASGHTVEQTTCIFDTAYSEYSEYEHLI